MRIVIRLPPACCFKRLRRRGGSLGPRLYFAPTVVQQMRRPALIVCSAGRGLFCARVMSINATYPTLTYNRSNRLRRCRCGAEQLKQLAGAALISSARGGPDDPMAFSPDLVFLPVKHVEGPGIYSPGPFFARRPFTDLCSWLSQIAPVRPSAIATLNRQRHLTPSCGGFTPTAERTVGPARMIVGELDTHTRN